MKNLITFQLFGNFVDYILSSQILFHIFCKGNPFYRYDTAIFDIFIEKKKTWCNAEIIKYHLQYFKYFYITLMSMSASPLLSSLPTLLRNCQCKSLAIFVVLQSSAFCIR